MNGYLIVCELFQPKLGHGEKLLYKYPFITVLVYRKGKLQAKKYMTARLNITNKRLLIDRMSNFIMFPIPAIHSKRFSVGDIHFFSKKVSDIDVSFDFIEDVSYDEKQKVLLIKTYMDHTDIVIKSNKSKQIYTDLIKTLRR